MAGTMPAVETVIARASIAPPHGWLRMRAAAITAS
jgi:hypothetical protein